MLQLQNNTKIYDFDDAVAVIPSVCVGNVAQLACDLLISSKNLTRVGTFSHHSLIPVHGPSAYQHEPKKKVAACELYFSPEEKLLVFQFRSPFISRHISDFNKELATIIKICSRVIILSGSFGYEKRVIESCPYEFKANEIFKQKYFNQLNETKWKEFEGKTIFGGGNALQLYNVLLEMNIPALLLFRYLLEGDNSMDATLILREISEMCKGFLELKSDEGDIQLTVPISWKLLFGNEVPEHIF